MSWSGHLASGASTAVGGWGAGAGAASITGSSYHMTAIGVDQDQGTTGGNKDRSTALDLVQSIEVIKECQPPEDGGMFDFTVQGIKNSTVNKTLACFDDLNTTNIVENSTGPIQVDPGNTDITEAAGAGTDLANYDTSILCVNLLDTSSVSVIPMSSTDVPRVFRVDVPGGAPVLCTVTNVRKGRIIVDKVATPSDSTNFSFSTTGTGYTGPFLLADATTPNSQVLSANTVYTVTETVPDPWMLTLINCAVTDDGGDSSNDSTIIYTSNGGGDLFGTGDVTAEITLAPGETVDCEFTNSKSGTIRVKKVMVVGTTGTFSFTSDVTELNGDITTNNGFLPSSSAVTVDAPETYTVTESTPAGWDLTDIDCDDGNSTQSGDTTAITNRTADLTGVFCTT